MKNMLTHGLKALTRRRSFLAVLAIAFGAGGCQKHHDHSSEAHGAHEHTHEARHGGTPVVLGDEEYHIEFAYGEQPGVVQAFILDGHMENYIRIDAPSFGATAESAGRSEPLVFSAVANPATGETVGDSALFEASAPWLAEQPDLKLTIPAITVRGRSYVDVSVSLPSKPVAH